MDNNPSNFSPRAGETLPVDSVSWEDCQAFCQRLSERLGHTLTLPTEAQWEYACRAGSQTPFNTGNNLSTEQGNYNGNSPYADHPQGEYRERTLPVKSFTPNDWGLYQMHGNLWEWCLDDLRGFSPAVVIDPVGPNGSGAVVRGGSWFDRAPRCRSASRYAFHRAERERNLGLRVAMVTQAGGERSDRQQESGERPVRSQAVKPQERRADKQAGFIKRLFKQDKK